MNCHACRNRLQPFLDDELAVSDTVAVLEHLDGCAACTQVVESERRQWLSLRGRLKAHTAPDALRDTITEKIRRDTSRARLTRIIQSVGPYIAAAAIIAAILIRTGSGLTAPAGGGGSGTELTVVSNRFNFATPRAHEQHVHGGFVGWAGHCYDELTASVANDSVLSASPARQGATATAPSSPLVAWTVAAPDIARAFGGEFRIPDAFLAGGHILGASLRAYHDQPVAEMVVAWPDREVALYAARPATAECINLHDLALDAGSPDDKRTLHFCNGCNVVVVNTTAMTWVVLSRQCRDWDDLWLADRASRIF